MKRAQINSFVNGISSDLDYMLRKSDSWDFPTLNYRILNKEGQGLIISTLSSNTRTIDAHHPEGEEFSLTENFICIGASSYRGILYLVSHNPLNGESEIGMFPSSNPVTNEWERIYRPFRNYVTNTPSNEFRTNKFNYSLERMCEVLCKESYDTSVDVYICDYENPNRVVNSGIKRNGSENGRVYTYEDFYSILNQMPITGQIVMSTLNNIEPGGMLKYGNYYFYFRYLTVDFNRTSFVGECGACQIYDGDNKQNKNVQGGSSLDNSNKKVSINISNLDETYTYIEVAYVRYYSDNSNVVYKEAGLIDKYYSITGNSIDIEITGNETIIPFTEAEINKEYPLERTCKTHVQVDNTYFGANWKSPNRNSKLLARLALYIRPSIYTVNIKEGSSNPYDNTIDINLNSQMQYKNYYMTFDKVGYFRGESYLITVGFVFADGSRSNVFPITGVDFASSNNVENNLGIVRFPFHNTHPTYINVGGEGLLSIIGLRFNMTSFINELNILNATDREWFANNVKGIFFARTKRKKWMKFQGLSIMGSNGCEMNNEYGTPYLRQILEGSHPYADTFSQEDKYPDDEIGYTKLRNRKYWNNPDYHSFWGLFKQGDEFNEESVEGRGIMPLFMHLLPLMSYKENNNGVNKYWGYYAARSFPEPELYGVYSPDFIFNQSNEDVSNYKHIKVVAKTMGEVFNNGQNGNTIDWKMQSGTIKWNRHYEPSHAMYPRFALFNMKCPNVFPNNVWLKSKATFSVGDGATTLASQSPPYNMINAAYDVETDSSNVFGKIVSNDGNITNCNRNLYTKKYIGLKFDFNIGIDFYNSDNNLDLTIVNIYDIHEDNFNLLSWYQSPQSYIYFQIGQAEEILFNPSDSNPFSMSSHNYVRFYGDCFLQRTFVKQMTWDASKFKGDTGNILGLCYSDALSECADTPVYSEVDGNSLEIHEKGYYRHGVIIGIVTENEINTAMRFTNTDRDYYPHYASLGWAYLPLDGLGDEAMFINRGHSEVLGVKTYAYYDEFAPFEVNIHPTRIRYSGKHVPYSFIDGYRLFDILSYQDYELSDGPINSLKIFLKQLVSVQENSVNLHKYGREEVTSPTSVGDIVLGRSDYLSPYVRQLGQFGTQHQFSVIATDNAIYGVDLNKRLIWGTQSAADSNGYPSMQCVSISTSKLIEKWLYDIAEVYTDKRSDIVSNFVDMPALFNGIVSGYDRGYDEVVFTFLRPVYRYDITYSLASNWTLNSLGLYQNTGVVNITQILPNDYFAMGKLYLINGEYYICIQSFFASGMSNDPRDYPQLVSVDDINVVQYEAGAYYTNQFVLVCDETVCPEYLSRPLKIARQVCENACLLIYVNGESVPAIDICKNLRQQIISVCVNTTLSNEYRTLVYNERLGIFVGEYSYGTHLYASIDKDFYSFKPFGSRSRAYLHNLDTSDLLIYNELSESIISIIVNGYSESENMIIFEKAFDNIHIMTNNIPFSSIVFQTENHIGIKEPFDSGGVEFWSDPEWLENKYYMPVQCQTEPSTNEFIEDSQLRGTWMKITLRYRGLLRKIIKNIITEFTQSES